jgi:hypothetical protein
MKTGINVPTGFETYIGVNKIITKKLGDVYSDCLVEKKAVNEYGKTLMNYFNELNVGNYDQNFCFTLCYQDKLINECGCCDIVTPAIRNVTFCDTENKIKCMENFDALFSTSDLDKMCNNSCPLQCENIEYNLGSSMATFPTLAYLKYLQADSQNIRFFPQNVSDFELNEFARQSFLKLIVNYDNLFYTLIDDRPKKEFWDIISDVGGQLGLFIGLSFFSFIGIVEFIIEWICYYCLFRPKNKIFYNPCKTRTNKQQDKLYQGNRNIVLYNQRFFKY